MVRRDINKHEILENDALEPKPEENVIVTTTVIQRRRAEARERMYQRINEPGRSSQEGPAAPPNRRSISQGPITPPMTRLAAPAMPPRVDPWLHLEDISPNYRIMEGIQTFLNEYEQLLHSFLAKWARIVERYRHRAIKRKIWSWQGKVLEWYKTRGKGQRHWIEDYSCYPP